MWTPFDERSEDLHHGGENQILMGRITVRQKVFWPLCHLNSLVFSTLRRGLCGRYAMNYLIIRIFIWMVEFLSFGWSRMRGLETSHEVWDKPIRFKGNINGTVRIDVTVSRQEWLGKPYRFSRSPLEDRVNPMPTRGESRSGKRSKTSLPF